MNILNIPTAEQFDVQNAILASIASNIGTGGMDIKNWSDVQRIVRMGIVDKVFTVGDQFMAEYNGVPVVGDVIGINHDKPTDKRFKHSLTIQFHDCLANGQFSAPQALYYAEKELPAGEQIFTQDSGPKYMFTTTQPIPVGGQIYIKTWGDPYVPLKATTYAADRTTVIESDLDVVKVATGTDTLLNVNVRTRCRYGSNNYLESAIKQWLNSDDESFKWEPKTNFDRPSTYATQGFLKLLDPELVAVLGAVDKQVARNTVTDDGGQDLFSDKVFLLSRVETGLGTEGTTDGESVYEWYNGISDAGRIKLLSGTPRHWWLRSPYPGYSNRARHVHTSGALSYDYASYALGLSPACCII